MDVFAIDYDKTMKAKKNIRKIINQQPILVLLWEFIQS